MKDSDTIFNELRTIRSRVESIEKTQEVLVRAERDKILAEILPAFQADAALGQVYLLVDGRRGQREISALLIATGTRGASESTVSRKLEVLSEMDLVELTDRTAAGNIYAKTSIDRLLKLTRNVERILQKAK
jgi:DNA-binding transcriptional ArsR family regulator